MNLFSLTSKILDCYMWVFTVSPKRFFTIYGSQKRNTAIDNSKQF